MAIARRHPLRIVGSGSSPRLIRWSKDTRNALMWLSAGEIATVALIGIAAVLLVFILIKRGIS